MNKQKGLTPLLIVVLIAIAVGGYLIYQKQIKPVVPQPVPQLSPSPVTSSTPTSSSETASWKTYNTTNFTVKYPTDWLLDGNSLYPLGKPKSGDPISNKPAIVLGAGGGGYNPPKETKTFPAGTAYYQWNTNREFAGGMAFFPIKGGYVILKADYIPISESETIKRTFDQILSTFKFTP